MRDGLEPVRPRILRAMHENGYLRNRPYRMPDRVVGDVIGPYLPHADQALDDALARIRWTSCRQPHRGRPPPALGRGLLQVEGKPYRTVPIDQNSVSPELSLTPSLSVTTKPVPAASMAKPSIFSAG